MKKTLITSSIMIFGIYFMNAQQTVEKPKLVGTLEFNSQFNINRVSNKAWPDKLHKDLNIGELIEISPGLELYVLKNKRIALSAQMILGFFGNNIYATDAPYDYSLNPSNYNYEYQTASYTVNTRYISRGGNFGVAYSISDEAKVYTRFGATVFNPISISTSGGYGVVNSRILGSGELVSTQLTAGFQVRLNDKLNLNMFYAFYWGTIDMFKIETDSFPQGSHIRMHALGYGLSYSLY